MKTQYQISIILIVLIWTTCLFADSKPATAEQVAMLTVSACAHCQNIQELDSLDIYVMGNRKIANALKKYQGQRTGSVYIRSIEFGHKLPTHKPTVLVCGDNSFCKSIRNYCRKNNVLSIAAYPVSCKNGLSVSLCQDFNNRDGESLSAVKVLLNLEAAFFEGIYWDKNIASVSQIIKPRDFYVYSRK
jgi:hypothetical protein